jgi:hypothetical protein
MSAVVLVTMVQRIRGLDAAGMHATGAPAGSAVNAHAETVSGLERRHGYLPHIEAGIVRHSG